MVAVLNRFLFVLKLSSDDQKILYYYFCIFYCASFLLGCVVKYIRNNESLYIQYKLKY